MVPVLPEIFGDHHNVAVQRLKHRLDRLVAEIRKAHGQRADTDIRDFGFLEVVVLEHKVKLFDDVAGIDGVVGARHEKIACGAEPGHSLHLLVAQAYALLGIGGQDLDILTKTEQIHRRAVFGETRQNLGADLIVFLIDVLRNIAGLPALLSHGYFQ